MLKNTSVSILVFSVYFSEVNKARNNLLRMISEFYRASKHKLRSENKQMGLTENLF
jgi:hypothetical protein